MRAVETRDASAVRIAWLLTRTLVLLVAMLVSRGVTTDVAYYHDALLRLSDLGFRETLIEYPVPAVALLAAPGLVGDSLPAYALQFTLLIVAFDALFTAYLYRLDGHRRGTATTYWLAVVPVVGPVALYRFDLVIAVVVAVAVIVLARRPRVAGALLALGVTLKLWPIAAFPALVAARAGRAQVVLGFAATGVLAVVASLAASGGEPARLLSPLRWQSDRGLHVESIWATPHVLARAFGGEGIDLELAFQAWQLDAPGTGVAIGIADVAVLLAAGLIAALFLRAVRHGATSAPSVALVVIAVAALVVVTNKTFSPQYVLWLAGPTTAALALTGGPALRRLAVLSLVIAALGQIVYPTMYRWLIVGDDELGLVVVSTILAVRNVAVVAFAAVAVHAAWQATARADQLPRVIHSSR